MTYIDGSPRIQHEIELFVVALESGTCADSLDLADRRAGFEEHRTRWTHLEHAERISTGVVSHRTKIIESVIDHHHHQAVTEGKCDLRFLQAPSLSRGHPQKE